MVTLIERGDWKVEVREDVADQFEVCPQCDGYPYRKVHVGRSLRGGALQGGWDMYETYLACHCEGGIRRRRQPPETPISTDTAKE